jgi:hypothetical protein
MTPNAQEIERLKPQISAIAERFGVTGIRLFGSVARGEAKPDSDVDLLVSLAPGRSLLDLIGFEQGVSDLLGCSVDVVSEGGVHPLVATAIIEEARPL